MNDFPLVSYCLSGPQNNKLGPDIIKWQYHQVINIKTGLKISLLAPECYRGLIPIQFPTVFFPVSEATHQ